MNNQHDDGGHLHHVKKHRKHHNSAESSNMRFGGYDDFYFPSIGNIAYERHGNENGRSYNVNSNSNRVPNYNPNSGIINNIPRRMSSAN